MKQIEVRLAVVLYGGVSLAVYIHGVTREILNLVRASKQFHAGSGAPPREDSTAVYFDLLTELSAEIDLRVVVDLISGASAGGINGVMLARALAHDLPLEPHRDLWLQNADVTNLAAPASIYSRAGKAAVAPLLDWVLLGRFGQQIKDPETRTKLRQFVQAQWFTPPFSGERFSGWMLDACDAMEESAKPGTSLLPPGHRLDLFVTLTDYRGHQHHILLHDPPSVDETEHRRIVSFTCQRSLSGEMVSEFERGDVPSLVFSARATASFPGAFPPASIGEMDRILAQRGRDWPSRKRLISEKLMIGDPNDAAAISSYFIDGSVVMNKPFSPVIQALGNRPASREVVRRIIYVDPNPNREVVQRADQGAPGFFRTILASLALIPRNEPIADDLMAIQSWNQQARRMAEILAAADPQVEQLVNEIIDPNREDPPTMAEVAQFRAAANERANAGANYAYLSYQTLKRRRLIDRVAALIGSLAKRGAAAGVGSSNDALDTESICAALDLWIGNGADRATSRLVPFLRSFDIDFRLRRIRFVIRRLNELYRMKENGGSQLDSGSIDELKSAMYEVIDRVSRLWDPAGYDAQVVSMAVEIVAASKAGSTLPPDALAPLDAAMGLLAIDRDLDEIVSLMGLAYLPHAARRALATSYIGFAFYDLITFPVLQWTDMNEINEVLVDRISPADAHGFGGERPILKGVSLMNFGAFFNRAWREHDYLWGRLNAADRCVDVLMSAVGARRPAGFDPDRIRARLFAAILDAEAPHLLADAGLIPGLRKQLADKDARSH